MIRMDRFCAASLAVLAVFACAAAADPTVGGCNAEGGGCGADASASDRVELLQQGSQVQPRGIQHEAIPVEAAPGSAPTREKTEMMDLVFPLLGEDAQPLHTSLVQRALASAARSVTYETCFMGNVKDEPGTKDDEGVEHLHPVTVKSKDGSTINMTLLDRKPDNGRGMLCCRFPKHIAKGDLLRTPCNRQPEDTSFLTEIPDQFIKTSLSDESAATLALAVDQIAHVVRASPAATRVLVSSPVLEQVLSALGESDKRKVVKVVKADSEREGGLEFISAILSAFCCWGKTWLECNTWC